MTPHHQSDLDAPTAPTGPVLAPRLPPPVAKAPRHEAVGQPAPFQFVPEARLSPRPPRKRRRPIAWLVLLVLAAGAAVYVLVLREPNEATDDHASDPSAEPTEPVAEPTGGLPDLHFDRPALTSATWSETLSDLGTDASGTVQIGVTDITATADYVHSIVRFDLTGSATDEQHTAVMTPEYSYSPGDVFGAPWTRAPRNQGSSGTVMDNPDYLDVYQDLVTERVRAGATNVTTSTSTVDGMNLTTFEFDIDLLDLGEAAQQPTSAIVNPDLFVGHMVLVIDDEGLVRRKNFQLDEALMREAVSAGATSVPLSFGAQITSVNQPVEVAVPTDFVDQPGTTASVPVAGAAPNEACLVDQRTLAVAIETWMADHGAASAPTEAQLVTDGYLRAEFETYDVVDGTIVAVAGGPCVPPGP